MDCPSLAYNGCLRTESSREWSALPEFGSTGRTMVSHGPNGLGDGVGGSQVRAFIKRPSPRSLSTWVLKAQGVLRAYLGMGVARKRPAREGITHVCNRNIWRASQESPRTQKALECPWDRGYSTAGENHKGQELNKMFFAFLSSLCLPPTLEEPEATNQAEKEFGHGEKESKQNLPSHCWSAASQARPDLQGKGSCELD